MPEVAVHVLVAVTDDDRLASGPLGLEQPHVVWRHRVLELKEAPVTKPGVSSLSTNEAALLFCEDVSGTEAVHSGIFIGHQLLTQSFGNVVFIFEL